MDTQKEQEREAGKEGFDYATLSFNLRGNQRTQGGRGTGATGGTGGTGASPARPPKGSFQ